MSKILQQDYQEYSKLIEDGHSQRSACLILGLNRSTIQRYIKSVLEDEVAEGGEKYLELPNTEHVENKPKLLFYDIETSFLTQIDFPLLEVIRVKNERFKRVTY